MNRGLCCSFQVTGMCNSNSRFYKRKSIFNGWLQARQKKRKKVKKKRSLRTQWQEGLNSGEWMELIKQVSRKDLLCMQLRRVQRKTGCSTQTLDLAMGVMKEYLPFKLPKSVRDADKYMRQMSGARVMILHGCTNPRCPKPHVFTPDDGEHECPTCGESRYDANGKPKEKVHYFPLTEKLKELLKLPNFVQALSYNTTRLANANDIADVFDGPRWKQLTGTAKTLLYIGMTNLLFCRSLTCVLCFAHSPIVLCRRNPGIQAWRYDHKSFNFVRIKVLFLSQ